MGPLYNLRMGLVIRKTKRLDGWNVHIHPPSHGKWGRWRLGLKQTVQQNLRSFWVGELIHMLGGAGGGGGAVHPKSMGTEASI